MNVGKNYGRNFSAVEVYCIATKMLQKLLFLNKPQFCRFLCCGVKGSRDTTPTFLEFTHGVNLRLITTNNFSQL